MQEYAKENESIWEDVRHGLIYGSHEFEGSLKAKYLEGEKKCELPQHNSMFREFTPEIILEKAAELLKFDIERSRNKGIRLRDNEKENRDLIIYLLKV